MVRRMRIPLNSVAFGSGADIGSGSETIGGGAYDPLRKSGGPKLL